MLVLGLDPSLSGFGWALVESDATGLVRSQARGTWRTQKKDFPSFVDRYVYLRGKIQKLISESKVDRASIESPTFGQEASSQMHSLFTFSCEALRENQLDTLLVGNTQTKAWVRRYLNRPGEWTISKHEMVSAARRMTGERSNWTGDSADAFWVGYLGARFWLFFDRELEKSSLTPYEIKIFTEIQKPKKGKKAGQTLKKGLIHRRNDRFFLWSEDSIPISLEERLPPELKNKDPKFASEILEWLKKNNYLKNATEK